MNKIQLAVLVVDDEAAIRDMIGFALEQADMKIQSAANANEALLSISENRPDKAPHCSFVTPAQEFPSGRSPG